MALTKEEKSVILEEVTKQLENASTVYLTNCSGLSVESVNALRNKFRDANIGYRVVKNTLLRLAMDRVGGYQDLYGTLEGPTAVAFSNEPAAPARVIKEFSSGPGNGLPQLKSAFVDGAVYDGSALDLLVALKSKNEIIGDVIGLLLSPMTNVVGALQAQGGNLVGAIKTISEREG
ncbi:MAG: 50S ribosomal protein L10 [Rhodothermales bacterium]